MLFENLMLWHQFMLGYVDEEFLLTETLDNERSHILDTLIINKFVIQDVLTFLAILVAPPFTTRIVLTSS